MTSGIAAFGTTLKINGTLIAEIDNVDSPAAMTDYVELTHHTSPGGFKEYAASVRDGSDITLDGNFVPGDAGQAALRAANLAGTSDTYILTFPSGLGAFTFKAFAKNVQAKAPVAGKLSFTASLKVTGAPTFA